MQVGHSINCFVLNMWIKKYFAPPQTRKHALTVSTNWMTKMSGVVAPAVLDQNLHLHWGREVKTERGRGLFWRRKAIIRTPENQTIPHLA